MSLQISLNGEIKIIAKEVNLTELIQSLKLDTRQIAIALNDQVIPRSEYDQTQIKDGDTLEIVHASSGG